MPFNALVQEKILDFEALGIPEVFDRYVRFAPIQKPERNNLAQVIVGARRCGLQSLYLVFPLGDLSRSLAGNPRSSSKVYAVDPGMFTAFSRAASKEQGQRLETAVFNKLRRVAPQARSGSLARLTFELEGSLHEVDFVMGDALLGDMFELVQVSIDLSNPKTRRRELAALEAAMEKYGVRESTVVTMDSEETVGMSSGTVRVVPAWKWLLDE